MDVPLEVVHLLLRPVAVVFCLMELDPLLSSRSAPCGVLLGLAQFCAIPVDLPLVFDVKARRARTFYVPPLRSDLQNGSNADPLSGPTGDKCAAPQDLHLDGR